MPRMVWPKLTPIWLFLLAACVSSTPSPPTVTIASTQALPQASPAATEVEVRTSLARKLRFVLLDFKDADIKNVFRLLAEISGLNIVVTDDVTQKVTVRLIEVPCGL